MAEGGKKVAKWARDEALRAKEEAVFTRTEAECSKEKAEEDAYDLGVAETQATLKAQVLGYVGFIVPRFGTRLLNRLGLKPHLTCGKQSMCIIPLPSRKMPFPALRPRMLQDRLRLLALMLLWP